MDRFLYIHNLPKLSQEDIKNLTRPITSNGIELMIKSPNKEKLRISDLLMSFYQTFKEKLTPVHLKLFYGLKREETFQIHSVGPVCFFYRNLLLNFSVLLFNIVLETLHRAVR